MTHKKVVKHVGRKRPNSTGYERVKMTTEEFVKAVNAIDNNDGIKANVVGDGYVEILRKTLLDSGYVDSVTLAWLPDKTNEWIFRGDLRYERSVIPTKILKLMVEMAESREDDNKYVILNGNPFLLNGSISTRVFVINEGNLSLKCSVRKPSISIEGGARLSPF